jgi:hypothetical protein
MLPGDGLIDQRHSRWPPPPEQDGGNRDALGVLPGIVPGRAVDEGTGEPGVGMGRRGGGGGAPRLPTPVDAALGLFAHSLPPHPAIRGQGHVAVQGRPNIGLLYEWIKGMNRWGWGGAR